MNTPQHSETEAAIYVSDYASYNNGSLAGRWIEIQNLTAEEIRAEVTKVLKDNEKDNGGAWTCEEPMIQDYEGFPREFYSECMGFDGLAAYLELDCEDQRRFRAYLEFYGDVEAALRGYAEIVIYDNPSELIDDFIETSGIPDSCHWMVDRDAVKRAIEIDYVELDDGSWASLS